MLWKTGKVFSLYKFRSLTDKRDVEGKLLPDSKRLTRFGKLLCFTSFDKITEIFDNLKGDMAVVGPWPLLTAYLSLYNEHQTT